jgi:LuxR family transcriptional regulator, maltose regulon positive regulatory protein
MAMGVVLAAEGNVVEAERHLGSALRFFEDDVATVHHTLLLVLLAEVRYRRGRLREAKATLRSAREEIDQLADGGRVQTLLAHIEEEFQRLRGRAEGDAIVEPPSDAQLAVLELLTTDLSARDIGARLFISLNTVRSHTRALYAKLGVNSRAEAIARAEELGLLGG